MVAMYLLFGDIVCHVYKIILPETYKIHEHGSVTGEEAESIEEHIRNMEHNYRKDTN